MKIGVGRIRPWAHLLVIGTLAVGIGAATAVYAVFNHVLFRPVPGVSTPAASLVVISFEAVDRSSIGYGNAAGVPALREAGAAVGLERLAYGCCRNQLAVATHPGSQPSIAEVDFVTDDYFAVLGVVPSAGRLIGHGEGNSAMISDRLARSRFDSPDDAVGQTITVNGHPFVIAGVAHQFRGWGRGTNIGSTDVWLPQHSQRTVAGYEVMGDLVGRVRPGAALDVLEGRLQAVWTEFVPSRPERERPFVPVVTQGLHPRHTVDPAPRTMYRQMMGGAGLLLMLACLCAVNLLVAMAVADRRDFAIRAALGATRGRLLTGLVRTSLGMAAIATVAGVAVAAGLLSVLQGVALGDYLSDIGDVELDARVLGFCAVVTLAAIGLSRVAPALSGLRLDLRSVLAGTASTLASRQKAGRVLIAAQVALCASLAMAALVTHRSLTNLATTHLGMDIDGVIELSLRPDNLGYAEDKA